MGYYVAFSFTFICGLTLAVILQVVQGSSRCCTPTGKVCNINTTRCECNSGSPPKGCTPSPGDGEICTECCYPNYLMCINESNGKQKQYCVYFHSDICRNKFFTFAQVALVCALATAFSALGAICWRICRGRNAASVSSLLRERESSLTSVQRFILQRLQNRPPRYEDSNQIHLEKPPPYQEAVIDTIPGNLALPFSPIVLPSTPNGVPEEINSNLNCNESTLHSNTTERENFANVKPVTTNENAVRQQATQTEAVGVQNVQVNSDITSVSENRSSLEQRSNFTRSFESSEIKLTEEQNVSLPKESKLGVDNPAFSTEGEVTTEIASANQHLNK